MNIDVFEKDGMYLKKHVSDIRNHAFQTCLNGSRERRVIVLVEVQIYSKGHLNISNKTSVKRLDIFKVFEGKLFSVSVEQVRTTRQETTIK